MAIIKQYHKDTDTTYVYESTSYWDAEKGQSRSKRRVIGKLDPETGEIIPTGKRGRKKKDPDQDVRQDQALSALTAQISDLQQRILEKEAVISSQNAEIRSLREQNGRLQRIIHKVQMLCADESPVQG